MSVEVKVFWWCLLLILKFIEKRDSGILSTLMLKNFCNNVLHLKKLNMLIRKQSRERKQAVLPGKHKASGTVPAKDT